MPPNAAELALTLTSCPLLQKTAAAACGSAAAARRWLNRTEQSRVECCNGSSSLADPAGRHAPTRRPPPRRAARLTLGRALARAWYAHHAGDQPAGAATAQLSSAPTAAPGNPGPDQLQAVFRYVLPG